MNIQEDMEKMAQQAKDTAQELAIASTQQKNKTLLMMAEALLKDTSFILSENAKDMEAARKNGMSQSMLDRLLLTDRRIADMADGLKQVAGLPDPIGETVCGNITNNGLSINKVRVPLGVIGIIYESRPNVTADAAGLCLKTGNATILRGGSEAFNSNKAITSILSLAIEKSGLSKYAVQLVDTTDRSAVDVMLRLSGFIDVIIPRGGAGLIKKVIENSSVPVIETGIGICHTFVDESADLTMAGDIVFNAKVSRPSVCNAMETLLIHQSVVQVFLPQILKRLLDANVQLFGDEEICRLCPDAKPAQEENWYTEYSDLKLNIKIVKNLQTAMEHISKYGSKHSEAIITKNYDNAKKFQKMVDAAAVYVNASTRFTDGFEFGFGAEIGISTQKLHARGPMGLPELTSIKYIIDGEGQIR